MARVWAAQDPTLGRQVAVKVLREDLSRDPMSVQRFLQEAQTASLVDHPNVVDIIDYGQSPGGDAFLVMEYLEGEDLAALLKRHPQLPWPHVKHIALQMTRGLHAAHQAGVVHRDMTPANVFLVRTSDETPHVKLLDFGVAKMPKRRENTFRGSLFGTARYLSPEQATGAEIDARSEIYAVGVILYEALTGKPPFQDGSFLEIAAKHAREPPAPLRLAAPEAAISVEVEALVMKALEKKPEDRYEDMAEFEAAIEDTKFGMTLDTNHSMHDSIVGETALWGATLLEAELVAVGTTGAENPDELEAEEARTTKPYSRPETFPMVPASETFVGLPPPPDTQVEPAPTRSETVVTPEHLIAKPLPPRKDTLIPRGGGTVVAEAPDPDDTLPGEPRADTLVPRSKTAPPGGGTVVTTPKLDATEETPTVERPRSKTAPGEAPVPAAAPPEEERSRAGLWIALAAVALLSIGGGVSAWVVLTADSRADPPIAQKASLDEEPAPTKEDDPPPAKEDPPPAREDPPPAKRGPTSRKRGPTSRKRGPTSHKRGPASRERGPTSRKRGPASRERGPTSRAAHEGGPAPRTAGQRRPAPHPAGPAPRQGKAAGGDSQRVRLCARGDPRLRPEARGGGR